MSPRDVAFIGCRLLALYVLFSSLQGIVFNTWFVVQMVGSQDWTSKEKVLEWGFHVVPLVALLTMVAILWWGADLFAKRAVSDMGESTAQAPESWSHQKALSVAVVALGLWALISHLPTLVSYLFLLASSDPGNTQVVMRGVVPTLLAAGLGLFCILGSRIIADVVGRLRRW